MYPIIIEQQHFVKVVSNTCLARDRKITVLHAMPCIVAINTKPNTCTHRARDQLN